MTNVFRTKLMGGALVLAGALVTNTTPALAQDYGYDASYYNAPAAGQIASLVQRIALYPDPLLAQIFAAAAYPDQIAAAAQGNGGGFDPSVEALMQYPSVLQMMASDPAWTQALGQAVMQDQGAVMDAIQNLRRQAQQYGYLQSGPQMNVVDNGGYIDIEPVGGYMYVPTYDPYIVFARPRPGFFIGGAIRFGGGYHWVGGYNRFDWRGHQVYVNRRVWTPPVHRMYNSPSRFYEQRRFDNNRRFEDNRQFEHNRQFENNRRFDDNRRNFTGGDRGFNRNYTPPAVQAPQQRNFTPQQRTFTPQQPRGDFGRQFGRQNEQRSFTPAPQQRNFTPQQQPQQRNFAPAPQQRNFNPAPRQEQRNFNAQPRNNGGGHFDRGGEGHGRGHGR